MKCGGGVNKLVLWPETGARVCVLQVTNDFLEGFGLVGGWSKAAPGGYHPWLQF